MCFFSRAFNCIVMIWWLWLFFRALLSGADTAGLPLTGCTSACAHYAVLLVVIIVTFRESIRRPLPDVTPAARKWTRWSSAVLTFVWGCWCYDFVCYTKHQIVTPSQLVPGYAPEWAIAPDQGQLQCELQLNQQTSPCCGRVYAKTGRVNVA